MWVVGDKSTCPVLQDKGYPVVLPNNLSLVVKQAPVSSAVGVARDCLERNVALTMKWDEPRRPAALRATLPGGSERAAARGRRS